MPLETKFRRIALLMEPDIAKMFEKQAQRTAGCDDARHDEANGVVSYYKHGGLMWQPRAEMIGFYSEELGMLRWWWAGFTVGVTARSKLELSYREGQRYGLSELTTDAIHVDDADAELCAKLCAQLSRADGMLRIDEGRRTSFIALFDPKPGDSQVPSDGKRSESARPAWLADTYAVNEGANAARPPGFMPAAVGSMQGGGQGGRPYTVAPPAPTSQGAPPRSETPHPHRATIGIRSLAPVAPIDVTGDAFDHIPPIPPPPRSPGMTPTPPPGAGANVREPSREVFLPVAGAALQIVASAMPNGFHQALVVIRVEQNEGRVRFFVQLVASDPQGTLVSLDPNREILEATGKMIGDDARSGNGRWKKLVGRLAPSARGASIDVEVS